MTSQGQGSTCHERRLLIFISMPSQQHLPFFMDMLVFMHMPFFPQQLAAIAGDAAMTTSAAVAIRSFFKVFSVNEGEAQRQCWRFLCGPDRPQGLVEDFGENSSAMIR